MYIVQPTLFLQYDDFLSVFQEKAHFTTIYILASCNCTSLWGVSFYNVKLLDNENIVFKQSK